MRFTYKKTFISHLILTILYFTSSPNHASSGFYEKMMKEYYIENISAKQYLGNSQVWCIEEGDGKNIFVATGKSLSVYNGVTWRNYATGHTGITRWLAFDSDTKQVYAAIDNRFGVWSKNSFGEYIYTNLHQNEDEQSSEIFWRVYVVTDKVYFQTHKKIYCYNKLTNEISVCLTSEHIGYMHKLDNDIYVQSDAELLKLVDDKFEKTGIEIENRIIGILNLTDKLTIITEDKGVFQVIDKKIQQIQSPNNAILTKSRLFSYTQLSPHTMALGSVLDGVFIVDERLNIIDHINFSRNLKHTTVLSLMKDSSDDIWLGLDGGLARANRHPSEIIIQNNDADIGTVYDAIWINNQLYIATNKGLYTYDSNNKFRFIDGSQGQIWNLKRIDNNLIICHDAGLFSLNSNSNQLTKISNKRIWNLKQFKNDPNKYLSLDFNQTFSIYENTGSTLSFKKEIDNLEGAHTSAFIDRLGHIWVQDRTSTPIRIRLNADDKIESIKKYHLAQEIDTLHIAEIDNDIIFYANKAAYLYDIALDSLKHSAHYSSMIAQMQGSVLGISQLGRDNFFYASQNKIGQVKRSGNELYNYGEVFQSLDKDIPVLAHKIILLDNYTLATGIQGGIALHFTKNQESGYTDNKPLQIARIECKTREGNILLPINSENYETLPNNYTSLRIYFENMYAHHQIEYSIDDKGWLLSQGTPYLEFTHIAYGDHVIKVKNLSFIDPQDATITSIKIHVPYPWYMTPYFVVILIIIIGILIFLTRFLFKKRVKQQYEKIVQEQINILQKEKREYDMKILRIRLKEEEKSLVNLTMENVKRNAMLNEIRLDTDLSPTELADNKVLQKKLKHILKRIDFYLNNDDTQNLFEKYFNTIHDGFYDRLLKAHPDISRNDMKLCAYIKLNLDTKEIAAYMNIAPTSVEVARYRLRKKLNISQEINLQKYISDL